MSYRVINIYYSVTCYTNHINSTSFQSMASMALRVFPDVTAGVTAVGGGGGAWVRGDGGGVWSRG